MSFIHKHILKSLAKPRRRGVNEPIDTFTIRLNAGGIFGGLTVDAAIGGPRDLSVLPAEHRKGSFGNLISPGGVHFVTQAGKKWFIRYNEFSFVFNGREQPQPKFDKPKKKHVKLAAISQIEAVVPTQEAA